MEHNQLTIMKMDRSFGVNSLLHKRCRSVMKAMLPRKKTSKLRILKNVSWNQDDDSCYINITHFSMLDNELDGSLSLNKQKGDIFTISKAPDVHLTKEDLQRESYDISNVLNISPTKDDLTPPATPFGSSVSCSSTPISSNVPSLFRSEGIPRTPTIPSEAIPRTLTISSSKSQDSQIPSNISFMIVGHSSFIVS